MITFSDFLEKFNYPTPQSRITSPFNVDRGNKPVDINTMATKQIRQLPLGSHHVRWMINRDIPHIILMSLESQYPKLDANYIQNVLDSNNTASPLNKIIHQRRNKIFNFLRQRNVVGNVMEDGDEIIGFMFYELLQDHLSIIMLSAKNGKNKIEVAEGLLARLINKLSPDKRKRLVMSVPSNSIFNSPQIGNWLKEIGFEGKMNGDKIDFTYHLDTI